MNRSTVTLKIIFALTIFIEILNAQWEFTLQNPTNGQGFRQLAVSGTNLFAGHLGYGVFLSTDLGLTWNTVNTGLSDTEITALMVKDSNIFAGTYSGYLGGGVFRSTNNGGNWIKTSFGLPNTGVCNLTSSGHNIFAAMYQRGVYRSTDNGDSWISVSAGLAGSYYFALSADNASLVTASDSGMYRSTDSGTNWTKLKTGMNPFTISVAGLLADSPNIFAGTINGGVWRSTNNGISWIQYNIYPPSASVHPVVKIEKTLFLGSEGAGVCVSTNNGQSWYSDNYGFVLHAYGYPTPFSFVLCGKYLFTTIYTVGEYDEGIWRRPLSEIITSVNLSESKLPEEPYLEQNFPNPFNPSTTISFVLPSDAFVTLEIFDLLGRNISTIVSDKLSVGNHSYNFNAATLPSGIYLCRLHAGHFVRTKKIIFLK